MKNINNLENFRNEIKNLEKTDLVELEKDLIKVKVFENDSKEYKIIDCYNPIDIIIISNQYDRYEYLN